MLTATEQDADCYQKEEIKRVVQEKNIEFVRLQFTDILALQKT